MGEGWVRVYENNKLTNSFTVLMMGMPAAAVVVPWTAGHASQTTVETIIRVLRRPER